MALLLDTHVWMWLVFDEPDRITPAVRDEIDESAQRNELAVSEVSFWEVALKASKGRLDLPPNPREWLARAGRMPGVGIIQIDRQVMIASTELDLATRDPADRMLVATALQYDLRLATADSVLINYAQIDDRLAVLDCRVDDRR